MVRVEVLEGRARELELPVTGLVRSMMGLNVYMDRGALVEVSLEELVLSKKLNHGNHPVLRWMMSNVSILQDPAGNWVEISESRPI